MRKSIVHKTTGAALLLSVTLARSSPAYPVVAAKTKETPRLPAVGRWTSTGTKQKAKKHSLQGKVKGVVSVCPGK